jgi:hypothetical protein
MRLLIYLGAVFIALDEPTNITRFGIAQCFQKQISLADVYNTDCTDLSGPEKIQSLHADSVDGIDADLTFQAIPVCQPSFSYRDFHAVLRC